MINVSVHVLAGRATYFNVVSVHYFCGISDLTLRNSFSAVTVRAMVKPVVPVDVRYTEQHQNDQQCKYTRSKPHSL